MFQRTRAGALHVSRRVAQMDMAGTGRRGGVPQDSGAPNATEKLSLIEEFAVHQRLHCGKTTDSRHLSVEEVDDEMS